jgi:hypothetical protein
LSKKDSISLLQKKIIEKNGHEISFFFYKIKRKNAEIDSAKNQLVSVAFINENKKINPLAFKVFNTIPINEEENLEESYNLIINESLNIIHPRASFEKEKKVTELIPDEGY